MTNGISLTLYLKFIKLVTILMMTDCAYQYPHKCWTLKKQKHFINWWTFFFVFYNNNHNNNSNRHYWSTSSLICFKMESLKLWWNKNSTNTSDHFCFNWKYYTKIFHKLKYGGHMYTLHIHVQSSGLLYTISTSLTTEVIQSIRVNNWLTVSTSCSGNTYL